MKNNQYSLGTLLRVTTGICIFLGVFRRVIFNTDFLIGFHDGFLSILWLFGFDYTLWRTNTDDNLQMIGFVVGFMGILIFSACTFTTILILLFPQTFRNIKK